jgi:hypothetical protein
LLVSTDALLVSGLKRRPEARHGMVVIGVIVLIVLYVIFIYNPPGQPLRQTVSQSGRTSRFSQTEA